LFVNITPNKLRYKCEENTTGIPQLVKSPAVAIIKNIINMTTTLQSKQANSLQFKTEIKHLFEHRCLSKCIM